MHKTLSFGAVIWDIMEGEKFLGGDSLNLAAHLTKLGAQSYLLTRLGNDVNGAEALEQIPLLGVRTAFIQQDADHKNGYSKVVFDEARVPQYEFCPDASDEFIQVDDEVIGRIKKEEFSIFCYGSYCQPSPMSRDSLYRILEQCQFPLTFCDINIRRNFYEEKMLRKSFLHADILKLNEDEATLVSQVLYGEMESEIQLASALQKEFSIQVLCITKGDNGCTVYNEQGQGRDIPSLPTNVIDTVGAGDAFSGAFLTKYYETKDAFEAGRFGNLLGGFVSSMRGGIPAYSPKIKNLFGLE